MLGWNDRLPLPSRMSMLPMRVPKYHNSAIRWTRRQSVSQPQAATLCVASGHGTPARPDSAPLSENLDAQVVLVRGDSTLSREGSNYGSHASCGRRVKREKGCRHTRPQGQIFARSSRFCYQLTRV